MSVMECFSERLKELREEKGISQTELGDKLGVSRSSISFYEKAERIPDIELLAKAAAFFSVPVDYLLGLSNVKSKKEPKIKDICDFTGLSERAVCILGDCISNSFDIPLFESEKDVLNKLIAEPYFWFKTDSYKRGAENLKETCEQVKAILEHDSIPIDEKKELIEELDHELILVKLNYFEAVEKYVSFLNNSLFSCDDIEKEVQKIIFHARYVLGIKKICDDDDLADNVMLCQNDSFKGETNGNDNEEE